MFTVNALIYFITGTVLRIIQLLFNFFMYKMVRYALKKESMHISEIILVQTFEMLMSSFISSYLLSFWASWQNLHSIYAL